MYQIQERSMDVLIQEAMNISNKLVQDRRVPMLDLNRFGQALLAVQTEVEQQKPIDKGIGV